MPPLEEGQPEEQYTGALKRLVWSLEEVHGLLGRVLR
jgi:hypothetical protein